MSMSISSGSSQSTSTSNPVPTHENDLINQLSGVASGLANQMLNWAQSTYAKTSQITDQAVGNFFQTSQQMLGLSGRMTDQYNNLFAPENKQLVADANSYNSAARQKVDMGQAGATQAQAGDAALHNSEAALQSYGIDPSSGRYAALDKAAAVQNAANVAGAMNTQRNADVATGQRLRSEAVQVGAQLPAAIANVNNTAIQANTGASNASLANANTGRNLMSLPNDFLKTAMDIKLPPMGTQSQSSSQQQGSSSSPGQSRSSGGGSGGGAGGSGNPFGPSAPAWMPQHGGGGSSSGGGGGGRVGVNPSSHIFQDYDRSGLGNQNDFSDPTGQNYDPLGGIDPNSFDGSTGGDYYQPEQGYNMGSGDAGYSDNPFNDYSNPFDDRGFGQNYDYGGSDQTFGDMGGGANTEWGNISYDPQANSYDPGWENSYDQPVQTNWGNGADQYTGGGYGDASSSGSDYYAGDYTAPSDNYDMGGAYARGGAIPPAHAGPVPRSMSPSGGQQIDDVRAQGPGGSQLNLNANEFVIPQDVALWKGQEFFQKLIDQSRRMRVTAPAQPTRTANAPA